MFILSGAFLALTGLPCTSAGSGSGAASSAGTGAGSGTGPASSAGTGAGAGEASSPLVAGSTMSRVT